LRVSAPVERDVATLLALSAAVRESPSAATKDPFSGKLERLTFSSRAERERERERERAATTVFQLTTVAAQLATCDS